MRPRHLVLLVRLALLAAIAASAALVVDYRNAGDPAFCGVGSGCFAVRISPYSSLLGIPLPNIGLAAFAALLAASLLARAPAHHKAVAALAVAGGLGGTALLVIQAVVIGAVCPWCTVVDIAAVVAAGAAVLLAWQSGRVPREQFAADAHGPLPVTGAWSLAALAAIGLPFLWGNYPVLPELPRDIAALQVPGKITIVGFTDFECPFCRKLHPEMERLKQEYGDRIHYLRKMMPLSGHPGAMPAAKAYVCAPEPQRNAAAGLLYEAPEESLSDAGVAGVLSSLGIDQPALKACLSAPQTQAAIAADMEMYDRLEGRALPLTYIGRRVVLGYNPDRITEAVRLEAAGDRLGLPLAALLAILAMAAAGAAAVELRQRGGALAE
jgi:uncharacterized membrane protein/thiol-disulfide isomerase/thioredoxin